MLFEYWHTFSSSVITSLLYYSAIFFSERPFFYRHNSFARPIYTPNDCLLFIRKCLFAKLKSSINFYAQHFSVSSFYSDASVNFEGILCPWWAKSLPSTQKSGLKRITLYIFIIVSKNNYFYLKIMSFFYIKNMYWFRCKLELFFQKPLKLQLNSCNHRPENSCICSRLFSFCFPSFR